ncbi:type II toxin-antitoxin system VapC family toxin [Methylobacterium sp. NEAU 140]|uniref:PIN domain-containing protein n=1 Tax=Methylobacterium sp. NEAU 140 TaxID=3064945 RepID=UPI002734D711|nr:type II toxin-antitoxin system VapC family toxin [Methylobacterium sp. NEAU 140]MDP4024806.1 type II toxin-antitoxin system VapC family toxin [Methylobacterium sp. NEAU 140]
MIGLDTNVLLRWLVDTAIWPDDAPQETALVAETLARRDARFFVNVIVLAETVWVLARPLRQRKALLVTVVRRLLGAANIEIDQREAVTRALAAWATGAGDFADHLLGALNEQAGCATTLTFDRKAARAGPFTHLVRET